MKPVFIIVFCFIYFAYKFTTLDHIPRISMFDVGQGDAILVTLVDNKKILIDGGDNFEIDRYLSDAELLNRCHLDIVILTHPHADHLMGLYRVAQRCEIDLVVSYPVNYESILYSDWADIITSFDVYVPEVGDIIELGEVQLVFLGPRKEYENVNNSSVSFLLKSDTFDALFLGDLEVEGLTALKVRGLVEGDLDVLKVPHHGGMSSYFSGASKLHPKYCLISVGKANTYGHPHQQVLDFYNDLGCSTDRTDLSGTLEILIN